MSKALFEIVENYADYAEKIAEAEKICFSEPWSISAVESFFSYEYNSAIIILCNGEFAGYVTCTFMCSETQIAKVAVLPEFRKMGAGFLLMSSLVQMAKEKNCPTVTLEVRASNIPAINLYKKCGFEVVGERKNFYKNPKDDAVLMNFYAE